MSRPATFLVRAAAWPRPAASPQEPSFSTTESSASSQQGKPPCRPRNAHASLSGLAAWPIHRSGLETSFEMDRPGAPGVTSHHITGTKRDRFDSAKQKPGPPPFSPTAPLPSPREKKSRAIHVPTSLIRRPARASPGSVPWPGSRVSGTTTDSHNLLRGMRHYHALRRRRRSYSSRTPTFLAMTLIFWGRRFVGSGKCNSSPPPAIAISLLDRRPRIASWEILVRSCGD